MNSRIASLPDEYRLANDDILAARISATKAKFGKRLLVLTHHYQRMEIVRHGDHAGDSYGLAKTAGESRDAEFIVFCGVKFMAEAADILSAPGQKVFLPNPYAGCPMADMAPADTVLEAWGDIQSIVDGQKVIPVSYMNSSADLKAFTGANAGVICTSTNADSAFRWAFDQGEKLFFFPDQHLGRNTALKYGINEDKIVLFDRSRKLGGLSENEIAGAKIILWDGNCYVHTKFTPEDIDHWRQKEPHVKIVVHPECTREVVEKADAAGSTSFIVKYVEQSPPGTVIAIGTELNLVHRLALTHPDKRIFELSGGNCPICSNMFRTSLADLCFTLENIDSANRITVSEEVKSDAKTALERMLHIGI